ncbi:8045_t:CDS:2, partial [Acaulospora morrowiae]
AFGALLGLAIVPLSRDPYLVIMYALLGGCSFITGCLMLYFFKKYDDEEAANEKIIVVG